MKYYLLIKCRLSIVHFILIYPSLNPSLPSRSFPFHIFNFYFLMYNFKKQVICCVSKFGRHLAIWLYLYIGLEEIKRFFWTQVICCTRRSNKGNLFWFRVGKEIWFGSECSYDVVSYVSLVLGIISWVKIQRTLYLVEL